MSVNLTHQLSGDSWLLGGLVVGKCPVSKRAFPSHGTPEQLHSWLLGPFLCLKKKSSITLSYTDWGFQFQILKFPKPNLQSKANGTECIWPLPSQWRRLFLQMHLWCHVSLNHPPWLLQMAREVKGHFEASSTLYVCENKGKMSGTCIEFNVLKEVLAKRWLKLYFVWCRNALLVVKLIFFSFLRPSVLRTISTRSLHTIMLSWIAFLYADMSEHSWSDGNPAQNFPRTVAQQCQSLVISPAECFAFSKKEPKLARSGRPSSLLVLTRCLVTKRRRKKKKASATFHFVIISIHQEGARLFVLALVVRSSPTRPRNRLFIYAAWFDATPFLFSLCMIHMSACDCLPVCLSLCLCLAPHISTRDLALKDVGTVTVSKLSSLFLLLLCSCWGGGVRALSVLCFHLLLHYMESSNLKDIRRIFYTKKSFKINNNKKKNCI